MPLRHIVTILIFMLGGFVYYNWTVITPPDTLPALTMTLTGEVRSFPSGDSEKTSFYIKTKESNIYLRRIKVSAYFNAAVQPGDEIKIRGVLKVPPPPSNPGEFNYPAYLARKHVFYIAAVKNSTDLNIIKNQAGWKKWITTSREKGEKVFDDVLPAHESAVLNGMLLGKIDEIDPEQNIDFQTTGIFHVFSVSGLHVGFLLILNGWILSLLKTSKRSKLISGLLLLILYGSLVGWPVSLQRAAIMGSLGLLAYYSGRRNDMLNAIALAGIIILAINPAALLDISFQLSFAATFGLIYIFPLIRSHLTSNRYWDILLVPVCAEIAIIPLIVCYFNLFSPVSIITNILSAYITGGIVILGFLGFLTAQLLPGLAFIFLIPAGALIEILLALIDTLKNLPGSFHWTVSQIVVMVLFYLVLGMGLWALKNRNYKWAGGACATLILIIASFYLPADWNSRGLMKVVFLDVGQGDSTLIKTPQGKFILIDGGGSAFYDVGTLKVLPYLHRCGINNLFMAINTHPDVDHLKGLERVVATTPVGHVAVPASLYQVSEYDHMKRLANKVIPLSAGQTIELEKNCRIKVLLPDKKTYELNNFNNQSLLLELIYGDFRLLLTGDIEKEAIDNVITSRQLDPVTVVKVPHHGSRNSLAEPFYDITHPAYAVISVGRNNSFGHPHLEVTNMLKSEDINVLRTDQDGAIIMTTDGQELKVETTL